MIRNPPGAVWCATPGCALLRITPDAIRKMIVRTGNAYRSKTCTRL
jgi:hypothetical protein